jgi:hypothetical protein
MASRVHSCCDVISLRKKWHDFKALPPGRRFQTVHEQQQSAPWWVKPAVIATAAGAFAIGILLTFIPGPAFVFYGLAGALAATESAWLARTLDRGELAARRLIARFQHRRAQAPRKLLQ